MKTMSIAIALSLLIACAHFAPAGEIEDIYKKAIKDKTAKPSTQWTDYKMEIVDHGVTEIGIEHTPCYGPCPVFTFIMKNDGTFRYHGDSNVNRVGDYTGTVDARDYSQLAEFIKQSDFMKLDDTYETGVTDNPTVFTTVVIDGKRKTISNYASAGPAKLWAVERLIDSLMSDDAEWNPTTKPTAADGAATKPAN